MRWAAMLRGINLGKRQLKSAELAAVVKQLGYADVKTLLASGNVVFDAAEREAAAVERALHKALADATGLKSEVLARNRAELARAIAANPFAEVARARPSQLVVIFHREAVPRPPLAHLAEHYDGPERLEAIGRELFIDFPRGQGGSRLVPAMAKARFPATSTGRNWNTVTKLLAALGDG